MHILLLLYQTGSKTWQLKPGYIEWSICLIFPSDFEHPSKRFPLTVKCFLRWLPRASHGLLTSCERERGREGFPLLPSLSHPSPYTVVFSCFLCPPVPNCPPSVFTSSPPTGTSGSIFGWWAAGEWKPRVSQSSVCCRHVCLCVRFCVHWCVCVCVCGWVAW